ncbi:hypothetical protein [Anaerosacchariphilus polymeriproducens]|uniref:hypothetical protein n=1 Tax=Anaerosacchariphilus polymeriproducens TaxID=1812858 RepID=UPI0012D7F74C|nr:hypothetical protein [Anaerosacchariphilus polymeriproducens]
MNDTIYVMSMYYFTRNQAYLQLTLLCVNGTEDRFLVEDKELTQSQTKDTFVVFIPP